MPRLSLMIIALAGALAGCVAAHGPVVDLRPYSLNAKQMAQIRGAAGKELRDPDGAQFRNIQARRVRHQDGTARIVVCGAMNAKNQYGGYVGYSAFGGEIDQKGDFTLTDRDTTSFRYVEAGCRQNYGMPIN